MSIDRSVSNLLQRLLASTGKYIGKAPPGSVKAAALMAAVNAQQGDTRVHVFKLVILNRVKTLHAFVSFSDDCSCWRIFVSLHKDR